LSSMPGFRRDVRNRRNNFQDSTTRFLRTQDLRQGMSLGPYSPYSPGKTENSAMHLRNWQRSGQTSLASLNPRFLVRDYCWQDGWSQTAFRWQVRSSSCRQMSFHMPRNFSSEVRLHHEGLRVQLSFRWDSFFWYGLPTF
jgi:hypothetical protein